MPEPPFLQQPRAAYDAVAADYADLLRTQLDRAPWDRAVLSAFAEQVAAQGGGPVLDAGCGSGRVSAHLARLGLDVSGLDLSPGMVAVARRDHPHLVFEVGSLHALPQADASLAGLLAWYSLIHVPPAELPAVLAELARVLVPGGRLLLAFQVGDERRRIERPYGHDVVLDAHRLPPERVAAQLRDAGLDVDATLVRAPEGHETVPQAYLTARRRAA